MERNRKHPRRALDLVLLLSWCFLLPQIAVGGLRVELEGPSILGLPPPVTYFSNSVGATLPCLAKGHPPLKITWLTGSGAELPLMPQIPTREVLPNGSLTFGSFRGDEYGAPQGGLFTGEYRCLVSNPLGSYISPLLTVRAILDAPFDVSISAPPDPEVIANNPLILHCNVQPILYRDFVQIFSWKSVDQYGYESEITSDGIRYQVTSGGSLLIFSTTTADSLFICYARNTLNGRTQASSPILIKGKAVVGGLAPKSTSPSVRMNLDRHAKSAELVCSIVGNPPPNIRWTKLALDNLHVPVMLSEFIEIKGPLLIFSRVESSINGSYRCEAVNNYGSASLDFSVSVTPNPVLTLEPRRSTLRTGGSIELTCKITPISSLPGVTFKFFRNGTPLSESNRVTILGGKLSIFNTQIEDQGVYQAFAALGSGKTLQASSELFFEASAPELVHTFIPQSLQPGPFISLKCSATGNPTPQFRWLIDGQEMPANSADDPIQTRFWKISDRYSIGDYRHRGEVVSHLNISNVRGEDGAFYECVASNLMAERSYSARLNIYGPLFVKEMPPLTLETDSKSSIPCYYGGFPVDKVNWQKNGKDLTSKGRIFIGENGTLKIEGVQPDDRAQYTCIVQNRKGEIASGSVDVSVMRPPSIAPFSFDEGLLEGQRASVTCNVADGDLPIEITWEKDRQPIPPYLNVTQMRVKFFSYLIFEELEEAQSGVYTCKASNAASSASHSANLTVKVPPRWVHEPQDAQVLLGADYIFPCIVYGVPPVETKWLKDLGVMKTVIKTDEKYEILEDGALKIKGVDLKDSTIGFICEAWNGIGNGIWKSIRISVNTPPKISAPQSSIIVAEGTSAILRCDITGDKPLDIIWKRGQVHLIPNHRSLLGVNSTSNNSVSAELRILQSEKGDSGEYFCSGSNPYGRQEARIYLEVKARPLPPEDFIVEEIGSRFIKLKWTLPSPSASSGSSPIKEFIIQFKKSSNPFWNSSGNQSVIAPLSKAIMNSLSPVTNYDIRLLSANEIGVSVPTSPVAVLTLPEAPSGSPLNVSALPIANARSILVRWEPPHISKQNGAILGFQIIVKPTPEDNGTIVMDEKWNQHIEVTGLKPNSQYRVSVRAYNSAGVGPESPYVSAFTPEGAPEGHPLKLQCESLTQRALQVRWEPPSAHLTNGNILGFKVIYQTTQDEAMGEKPEVKKTSNRETTLHGLQSFANYSVRTLAFTLGGEGIISPPVYCLTEEDVPEPPSEVKVLVAGGGVASVNWLPPTRPNGVIKKYTISWQLEDDSSSIKEKTLPMSSLTSSSTSGDDQFSAEVRNLKENSRYTFWVRGWTVIGPGKDSRRETIVITSKVSPAIASFPVIKTVSVGSSVSLPCRTVGNKKVAWIRKEKGGGAGSEAGGQVLRDGSLHFRRVKEKDEGIYACWIQNDEIQHQIIISRPPPQIPLFLGHVFSNSVQIHWDSHAIVSSTPITGYVLKYQKTKDSTWTQERVSPKVSSTTLEGLHCGTSYAFKLAGVNSVGQGPFSPELKISTRGNPPESPRLTDIINGNGTALRIDLTRWPDGGCPLHRFHIEYKPQSSDLWQRIYRPDNSTRDFTFGTKEGLKYDIRISVENDAGSLSKTFGVESLSEFFANYGKMLERTEERSENGAVLNLLQAHVLVPIVSAIICICALLICILIVYRKRSENGKEEWKFVQSSSQQTWLTDPDNHVQNLQMPNQGKFDPNHKCDNIPSDNSGNMSIYATLNSGICEPPLNNRLMTIRDPTVRLKTFGQMDNYDAPTLPYHQYNKKKQELKRKTSKRMTLEDEICDQGRFPEEIYPAPMEYRFCQGGQGQDSEDSDDEMNEGPNYAQPYQVAPAFSAYRKEMGDSSGGRSTRRKKKKPSQRRGSSEYLD